eukprot:681278-Alexandrium_andersonii.AAC.1
MARSHSLASRAQRAQMERAAHQGHAGYQRCPSRRDRPVAPLRLGRGSYRRHVNPSLGEGG